MIQASQFFNFLSGTLDSRIVIARALNTATRINSSGVLEIVNADLPRFDYDFATLAPKGLLIEEQRRNELLYSSTFDNGAWGLINGGTGTLPVVTANYAISPDGTMNAYRLQADRGAGNAGSDFSILRNIPAVTYSNPHNVSISIWAKSNTSNNQSVYFRNSTGSAGSVIVVTTTWQRFNFSASVSLTSENLQIGSRGNNNVDNAIDILIYNSQLEIASFPTSDIINEGTRLTRNADVATITGTDFSDFWKAAKGGAIVRATPYVVTGTRPLVQFDDNTANEIIALRGNGADPELYIVDGGTPQAQIDAGTIAAGTPYSLAAWWQENFCGARLNANARVIDSSATIPTVTQMRIGSDGTNYLNGHIASIGYYDKFSSQIYSRRKNKAVFSVI